LKGEPDKMNGLKKLIPSLRDLVGIEHDFWEINVTLNVLNIMEINFLPLYSTE
jgi:hypothetical protein